MAQYRARHLKMMLLQQQLMFQGHILTVNRGISALSPMISYGLEMMKNFNFVVQLLQNEKILELR